MVIKMNPIIDFNRIDIKAIARTRMMCDRLIEGLMQYTISEDACITCADNGEIFVTEKELFAMYDVLLRMERIMDEAPLSYDEGVYEKKALAVVFEG